MLFSSEKSKNIFVKNRQNKNKNEELYFQIWVFNDPFNQITLKILGQTSGLIYFLKENIIFIRKVIKSLSNRGEKKIEVLDFKI